MGLMMRTASAHAPMAEIASARDFDGIHVEARAFKFVPRPMRIMLVEDERMMLAVVPRYKPAIPSFETT